MMILMIYLASLPNLSLAQLPGASIETTEAVRVATMANRVAFTRGSARFRYEIGPVESLDALRDGRFKPLASGQGLYEFDGTTLHYECVFPPEQVVATRTRTSENGFESNVPTHSFRAVTDGRLTLWDDIAVAPDDRTVVHAAQIDPGTSYFSRFGLFPLFVGIPEPKAYLLDEDIQAALKGSPSIELTAVDPKAEFAGFPCVLFEFTLKKPTDGSVTGSLSYWVDLEHGAIPRQIIRTGIRNGRSQSLVQQVYDDIREVPGIGWFPYRYFLYLSPGLGKQFVVEEAVFGPSAKPPSLRLEFPEPIPMVDTDARMRYAPRTVWDLKALPRTAAGTEKVYLESARLTPPALPGERASWPWWIIPVFLLGLIAGITAALLMVRRARPAHG